MPPIQEIAFNIYQWLVRVTLPYSDHRETAQSTIGLTYSTAACDLFQWNLVNPNSTLVYVKLYDKAVPTSSDTPVATLLVPALGTVFDGNTGAPNFHFFTALGVRCTTGIADNDTAAPALGINVNLRFR